MLSVSTSLKARLEYAEFGQRLESGHGVLIEQLFVAARHARDVFRLGADCRTEREVGRNIARVQRNHSGDVFRRLVRPQIGTDERHIVIAETLGSRQ